jgi:hypothetical protein
MKDARLIPIKSNVDFETLCCDIAKEKYGDYEAQKYGRRGQKQWGVDIVASDRKKYVASLTLPLNSMNLNVLFLPQILKQTDNSKILPRSYQKRKGKK